MRHIGGTQRLFLLSKGTEEGIPEPQRKQKKKLLLLLLGLMESKGKTSLGWQSDSCCVIRQTCKHLNWSSSSTVHARKCFHHRGGNVGGLCAELYPSLRCRNVLTLHKHGNEWVSEAKSSRRKKGTRIFPLRRYAAETPSPLPSKGSLSAFHVAWELCRMMYCSVLVPWEPNGAGFSWWNFSGLHKQVRPSQRYWWLLAQGACILKSDQS